MSAGWSSSSGAVLRGELGQRITDNLAGFAYGQWTPRETSAGAGVRLTW